MLSGWLSCIAVAAARAEVDEEDEDVDIGTPEGRQQQFAGQLGVPAGGALPLLHLAVDLSQPPPAFPAKPVKATVEVVPPST